ncbi:MarR family winged helix-turn-helix transcriptional regulator [Viridibacillus arvi]|uniref:MarR family winged helix-turn-helix transcriptional regulator n=1 Tax=Viridibacillus arvi TaxID=263475 RepID=UPI0034CFE964
MSKEKSFHEMMETIYELSRHISSYESIPRKYGTDDDLFMVEAHTINLIGDKTQTNISELSRLTNKTKGALSQMVDRLIKKDMLTKTKNPLDNREVIIQLTNKGKVVYDFHKELDKVNYRELLKGLEQFNEEDFIKYEKISFILLGLMQENTK